jgi:hypothetical protein
VGSDKLYIRAGTLRQVYQETIVRVQSRGFEVKVLEVKIPQSGF